MANVTVPTSPPGVWPAETASIDETVYARVEADVLRRKSGDLLEQISERDRLDLAEKATHKAPKITTALVDYEAEDEEANVEFEVEFSGDPAPEVNWYLTLDGLRTKLADDTDYNIATDADSSLLTIVAAALAQDGAVIEAVVRNYKGEVSSSATLTVVEGA